MRTKLITLTLAALVTCAGCDMGPGKDVAVLEVDGTEGFFRDGVQHGWPSGNAPQALYAARRGDQTLLAGSTGSGGSYVYALCTAGGYESGYPTISEEEAILLLAEGGWKDSYGSKPGPVRKALRIVNAGGDWR